MNGLNRATLVMLITLLASFAVYTSTSYIADVKSEMASLQRDSVDQAVKIQGTEVKLSDIKDRVETIDRKIDRVWEKINGK